MLTYSARDGFDKAAVTTVVIDIIDVNDNPPTFLQRELIRNVPFGVKELKPPLFVEVCKFIYRSILLWRTPYYLSENNTDSCFFNRLLIRTVIEMETTTLLIKY